MSFRTARAPVTLSGDLVDDVPRLHIGYTWNRPSAYGTGTDTESKLLRRHAFETLGVFRVGLTTPGVDFPSRTAIERLGAAGRRGDRCATLPVIR